MRDAGQKQTVGKPPERVRGTRVGKEGLKEGERRKKYTKKKKMEGNLEAKACHIPVKDSG